MTLADLCFRRCATFCLTYSLTYSLTFVVLLLPALLLPTLLLPTLANAQDDSPLAALQQRWSDLESKFVEKQTAMESGDGDMKVLRGEYRDLVDQANDLIGEMKTAALAEIKKDPKNEAAIRTVMGILLNAAQADRDEEVLQVGDALIASGVDPRYFEVAAKADRLSIGGREIFEELLIREREFKADDLPRVKLTTTAGDVVVELYENEAPNTVANFVSLVESGYYDDMVFHRVLEDFMAQTGGFKSDGSGGKGPGYAIECECYTPETRAHFSNVLSMAHIGQRDTGGGQFFLTFSRTDFLDGRHTCFGRIIEGLNVLDQIDRTHISINGQEQPIPNVEKDRIVKAEVIRKRDHDYIPKKVGDEDPEEKQDKPPVRPDLSGPDSADDNKMPALSAPETDDDKKENGKSDDKKSDDEADSKKSASGDSDADKADSDKSKTDKSGDGDADQSESEAPKTDEPKTDEPKADEPKSDEPTESPEEPTETPDQSDGDNDGDSNGSSSDESSDSETTDDEDGK